MKSGNITSVLRNISITVILFSVLFALWQMVFLAGRESITSDEKAHIPAGFSYYQFRDFSLNPEHPPLGKLIIALPVFLSHPVIPERAMVFGTCSKFYYNCWFETLKWGTDFLYHSGNETGKIVFEARLMNIILTFALIALLIYWGYLLGSWSQAALAAVFASFQPVILAHGHLANTDIGITTFFAFLIFCWWKYLKKWQWRWFILSIFFFFLCAITKFTFIIFIPVLLTSAVFVSFRYKRIYIWKALGKLILFGFLVWVLVVSFYGFDFKLPPPPEPAQNVISGDETIKLINRFHNISIPPLFFKGLFMALGHAQSGHESYLSGKFSETGWWYYFPATIILKTPLGFLILFFSTFLIIKKLFQEDFVLQVILLSGMAIYLLLAMTSRADLGQRHIMPIYPLMVIFTSQLTLKFKKTNWKILISLSVAITIASVAFNFKNQIAYFNELVGGVPNGYRYLLDSNYDWGQSFNSIKTYINNQKLKNVYVDYHWAVFDERDFYLKGIKKVKDLRLGNKGTIIVDPTIYVLPQNAWMRKLKVTDRIDNTILVLEYNPDKFNAY